MAAQTVTITAAAPDPAAITLAGDTTCVHLSGDFGASGVLLTVSPDGSLPYVPLSQIASLGVYGNASGCHSIALKAGWRLRCSGRAPYGSLNVTVAVE